MEKEIPEPIEATIDSFRIRVNEREKHLEMPKRVDNETLLGYLGRLGLEIMREKEIDSNGSCAYDSILCLLMRLEQYKTLDWTILAMIDLSDPFPLRSLCQMLLRMSVQGAPWEHIYKAHEAVKGSDDEESVNMNTTVSWRELADGKRWADHSVLQLLAICLDINIVIIQEQNDKIMTVSTMLCENDGNMKEPILLLLESCHYLPLVDVSEEGQWYQKLSGMTSLPWVSRKKHSIVPMTLTESTEEEEEVVLVFEMAAKVVTSEPVVDCEECDYYCKDLMTFFLHQRSCHGAIYKYACKTCSFCSKSKEELIEHNEEVFGVGDEKKRLTCDICGRVYLYRQGLYRHKRDGHGGIDGGVQRYSCNNCGKTFSNNTHLNTHVLWAHVRKGEKRFKCQKCDYEATKAKFLSNHMKKKHKKAN